MSLICTTFWNLDRVSKRVWPGAVLTSSADIKALATSRPAVNAAIPDVVDKVYAKLLEHDVTARVFSSRDSRSSDDPEEWPTLTGKEISRRKIFLRWYLKKLNSDPTAKGYWQYLDKVA